MTGPVSRCRSILPHVKNAGIGLAMIISALLPSGVTNAGGGGGYWACVDGAWVAQGHPEHPMPLASCEPAAGEIIDSERECEAKGGEWRAAGIFPQKICILPTIDAGRYCRDEGECEGTCIAKLTWAERDRVLAGRPVAAAGTCSGTIPVFGCMAIVEKGYVKGILCLD